MGSEDTPRRRLYVALEAVVQDRIDGAFCDFASEVLGRPVVGLSAETVRERLRGLLEAAKRDAAGRHDRVNLYAAAADIFDLDPAMLESNRAQPAVDARWAVWSALRSAGWAAAAIGRESHPSRTWNHTTILAGFGRLDEMRRSVLDEDRARAARIDGAAERLRVLVLAADGKAGTDAAA